MSARISVMVLSLLIAVVISTGILVLGSVGWNGAIFLGFLSFVCLAAFLDWTLFHPLPKIENGKLKD
ncbi:MAG: hypothetical protein CL532_08400 [Aestuariivita sp.]|nr:hypothetical protein [Aestuariivita sp.]|tara:strand:+ start:77 stop:277 length:201 start_codon:yes stop_codon:yes gene_type:complete